MKIDGKISFLDEILKYSVTRRLKWDIILQELSKIKFNSLFDAGCHYGYYLYAIRKEYPNIRLAGADIERGMIDIAQKIKNVYVFQQDFNQDIKLNERFDAILSFDVIEHIKKDQVFLNNLFNLLNDGGILLLRTEFLNPHFNLRWLDNWVSDKGQEYHHVKLAYSKRELREMLAKAGFKIKEVKYSMIFFSFLVRILITFLARIFRKGKNAFDPKIDQEMRKSGAFHAYKKISKFLYCICKLDFLLSKFRGHSILIIAQK